MSFHNDYYVIGTTVNNIILDWYNYDYDQMFIRSGGTANATTVKNYCDVYVEYGGVANGTAVNGGYMSISSGGIANYTITQSAGKAIVYAGGVANNTSIYYDGHMRISGGGTANSTTIYWGGDMYVAGEGIANNTTVSGGSMTINSDGIANDTTVIGGGMIIWEYGVASDTTVEAGYMEVSSGAVANKTTVNGGSMYISSGGSALAIVENGGYVDVRDGANVTFAANTISGKVISGSMTVHKNTVASNTTVDEYGCMEVCSGGVANKTTVNCGEMYISGDGVANDTTINNRGSMYISSGGVANDTTVNNGGYMEVDGVANDTTVNNGGSMLIWDGVANDTTVNDGGSMNIYYGVVNNTTVNADGYMYIDRGGEADNTTINDYGYMYISSGGEANDTTVNNGGCMYISSGGEANDTTVNNGYMYISSGGVHSGSLQIKAGAEVFVEEGGRIDFTIAGRTTKSDYLISDLSKISGTPTYTITVSSSQEYGEYKLAQGAENFTGTITIGNGSKEIGTVTVNGDELVYNKVAYTLTQDDGLLKLTVSNGEYIFISSKFNEKTTGKKQNGITLIYGKNAFASIDDVSNVGDKTVILLDSKNSGNYFDNGTVAGTTVIPTIKNTGSSYSSKSNSAPKGTLNLTADTGTTEFVRFTTVNVNGATVGKISGNKVTTSEDITDVDKKGTRTYTDKFAYTWNTTGKFTAVNGSVQRAMGYSTVNLTNASATSLIGGSVKENYNEKYVYNATKDQRTISLVYDNVAAGSVTLKNSAYAGSITRYTNVTITDSTVETVSNFTSKESNSESATYDVAKNTITRKVTLSHSETTAGTLKATNAELGDVTGFATVTLKDVTSAGDFRRVDNEGNKYSSVKETLNIKTNKDGSVTGTYNKTETFTRAGKFTASGSVVGDIENFSNVTLDGSRAGAISNFETSKIVTKGTALWSNADDYSIMDEFELNLDDMDLTATETKSLNGSVTLKNNAYAESISNFQSVTMTGSEIGAVSNVTKATVNKGDSTIGSYTGTAGNDTLTIAKGAVLTANKIDLGKDGKDTLAINGTLVLTGTEIVADKITGKGEIAADSTLFADLDVAFANTLDVGKTSENFRGTAYENADDNYKKAVKWDGAEEYNGWLGCWDGYKNGGDSVDHIKFKAEAGDILSVSGVEDWTLLDKKGNDIGKVVSAAGEYTIRLNHEETDSVAYSIKLA